MIKHRDEFDRYIAGLPVAESTKGVYNNWVNRIDTHLPGQLDEDTVQSEEDVRNLALKMPRDTFVAGHMKDVRCIIRYYLKFLFARGLIEEEAAAAASGAFDSKSTNEARKKVWRSIVLRRGSQQFRGELLDAYNGACCVTRTRAAEVLEAAHIKPYSKKGASTTANGLLLRSDIHILFDLYLLSIDPDDRWKVFLHPWVRAIPEYRSVHGSRATPPALAEDAPDSQLLREHFEMTRALVT
jgi:hypothetical protein